MTWRVSPTPAAWDDLRPVLLQDILRRGLTEAEAVSFLVAGEEIFVNIASYSFPEGFVEGQDQCGITLEDAVQGDRQGVALTFTDMGVAFDPTAHRPRSPLTTAKGVLPGGFGIALAREKTDEMSYQRDGDRNVLRLVKYGRDGGSNGDSDQQRG